jgi:hypothetical protein
MAEMFFGELECILVNKKYELLDCLMTLFPTITLCPYFLFLSPPFSFFSSPSFILSGVWGHNPQNVFHVIVAHW